MADRNLTVLKDVLKKMSLLDRFELHELSPRCEGDFNKKLDVFCEKIAALPRREMIAVEAK